MSLNQKDGSSRRDAFVQGLADLASKILDEKVEPDQDLFAAGAQSVHLARLSVSIQKIYGVRVRALEIFDNPTVGELSRLVEARLEEGTNR